MPRLSINEMTTYRWSFLEDITGLQALGVESVGIWRRKLSDFGEERGVELLRESGLAVSSLWSAGGFTGSDGHTYKDAIEDALDALRLAAEMKAGCLVVVSGGRASHTQSHARRLLRDALCELGDAAAQYGLSIALAPLHCPAHDRSSFLSSLDAALEMLTSCDHRRVGLVFDFLDVAHNPPLCQRLAQFVPWIKIAALSDAHLPAHSDDDRRIPGRGQMPLAEIFAALEGSGYRGAYDVHLLGENCWRLEYPNLVQDCLEGLAALCPRVFARPATAPGA
jgi:sugar phosphate isomerase/epimerase